MKLVLNDNSEIELSVGNNQNQFVVSYQSEAELTAIEARLTDTNLSNACYKVNDTVIETLHNKVLSGSNRNIITHKATFYLVDAKTAEMEQLQATVTQLQTLINEQKAVNDQQDMCIVEAFQQIYATPTTETETTTTEQEGE